MYTKRDYDSSYTYSMTVFVTSVPESTRVGDETFSHSNRDIRDGMGSVSYTHLTLPTNREV